MAITTYAELKSAVSDFLNRDDLDAVVPTFISLAEAQMQRELRHPRMMQRSVGQIDSRYSPVPEYWLETIRFHISTPESRRLELTSLDDMMQLRTEARGERGTPTHYAHVGETLEVFPTPDAEYDIELLYYRKIPTLSDSNASNWILEIAPDAYLYGALVQSAPYLKDDGRVQVWGGLYAGAVQAVNAEGDKQRFGGSGMRMRIRSY